MNQFDATKEVMSDGQARSLEQIAKLVEQKTGNPTSINGISARLRDLRKAPHHMKVSKTKEAKGVATYLYRVELPAQSEQPARPISYGIPTPQPAAPQPASAPLAGSRAAMAFVDSLAG